MNVVDMRLKSPWIATDFNEVFDNNQIIAIMKGEPLPSVEAGDRVILYDEDDTVCIAIVMERRQEAILCKIDWSDQGPFMPTNLNVGVNPADAKFVQDLQPATVDLG